jgi:hypothetical protein
MTYSLRLLPEQPEETLRRFRIHPDARALHLQYGLAGLPIGLLTTLPLSPVYFMAFERRFATTI